MTTDPTRASNIRTRLANINNRLSSAADGRDRNGKFKWRANVFGTYSFKTEWLKNVSVGGGANFYGKQLIGNPTNNPFAYIYAKEYYILTATASYRFKLRNIPTTFAVNISNLLDYDDPIYSSVGVYQGFVYRNGFRYVDPRRATFTATLKF
jgi:outer membrane receptor for monomeric catechols